MSSEIVWSDSPSQTLNLVNWFISLVVGLVIFYGLPNAYEYIPAMLVPYLNAVRIGLPVIIVINLLWAVASVAARGYTLSESELVEKRGVINQSVDSLELFRVKDITIEKPLWLRIFRQGNLILHTSDYSTPVITLEAVDHPEKLMPVLRELVITARKRAGVREFD